MVVFDIWNYPEVAGVLAHGIAGILSGLGAFEVFLAGILLRYANGVKIEIILVTLCEPEDCLVTPGKPLRAVQAVFEVPDYPVPEL